MFTGLLSIISMIPGIGKVVQFCVGKFFDAKVSITTKRLGVDRDTAVALIQGAGKADHENTARLSIFAKNKALTFLVVGFATPLVILFAKIIIIDKLIGPGSVDFFGWHYAWAGRTDPLTGQVAQWANTIIYSLFGSSTVMGLGKMWFNRNKTGE